ncbi:MAG: hypothetical protein Q9162_000710, partial [Coniocarpon cinnabarinum]
MNVCWRRSGCSVYTRANRLSDSIATRPGARPHLWLSGRRFASSGSPALNDKPYYVTTPIFYVNAAPHVGHLYSMVLADILKRWNVLQGKRSILCTGTDEHGMKVQRAALKAETDPQTFCDEGAETFRSLAEQAQISQDHFVRTTDVDHKEAVQHAWRVLQEKDMIYLSKHEGWYSVSDEAFYPESAVHLIVDPPTGRKIMVSKETGKEVEWTSETNYRFRLSAMREQLLNFYEQHPSFIVPEYRMQDVVNQVTQGLEDLSISRPSSRLSWGVPVPDDDSQTIYVWLDALMNYLTKAGYPWTPGEESLQGWPADCHVIGKDIVRFHCIYWPAFLIALGVSPPKQVLTHAHWTLGREKMAKSTGNVVNPFFAIDRFEIDPLRYYLANDGGIGQDSDYSNEYIVARYKKDLQDGLGNLTSRIVRFKGWSVRKAIEYARDTNLATSLSSNTTVAKQKRLLQEAPANVAQYFDELQPGKALKEVMDIAFSTNAFVQVQRPWYVARGIPKLPEPGRVEMQAELDTTVYLSAEALRLVAILLQPFVPNKATQLADMLGLREDRRTFQWAKLGADYEYGTSKLDL